MTPHHGHRRHYVAPNEQEIPAFDLSSSSEITPRIAFLKSPAHRAEAILSDYPSQQPSQHSWNPPEALPAPFKLHKPPPSCRLPSSRCI
jgi:hypothetical protein